MIEEKYNVSRVQKTFGTYKFRIEGYSGLSNRVGDSVESPEFTLCGHSWQLRIFPGGSLESHKGYVSYYLASKSTRQARASYKLMIANQIPGGEDESFASSGIRVFEAKGIQVDGWGRDKFVAASMLKDSDFGLWIDDSVVFKVEITVCGELEPLLIPSEELENRLACQSLSAAVKALFDDSSSSDIKITSYSNDKQEITLHAHRCILAARSDYFRGMFRWNMKEATSGEVFIEEFDPKVIREMIHYMYTDTHPDKSFMNEYAQELLRATMMYQVLPLKEICEVYISKEVTIETAVPILLFAEEHGAKLLKDKTLKYIAQHCMTITQTKEYQELIEPLRKEAQQVIDSANKKRGCRGSCDKDKRSFFGCAIM
jgi:speckle-type POZ protein